MVRFFTWVRTNAQHFLLQDAHVRVAERHGLARPPVKGPWFWTKVFVPVYRILPWGLRRRVMVSMPGSHKQRWTPQSSPDGPAI